MCFRRGSEAAEWWGFPWRMRAEGRNSWSGGPRDGPFRTRCFMKGLGKHERQCLLGVSLGTGWEAGEGRGATWKQEGHLPGD